MEPKPREKTLPPPIPEAAKKRRVKSEPRNEPPATSELHPAEMRRRERAAWDVRQSVEACEMLRGIVTRRAIDRGEEDTEQLREDMTIREIASSGLITSRKSVGQPGVNVTEIVTIADTRFHGAGLTVKMVAKPASGEKTLMYDEDLAAFVEIHKQAKAGGNVERARIDPRKALEEQTQSYRDRGFGEDVVRTLMKDERKYYTMAKKKIESDVGEFPGYARSLADEYGVDVQTIIGLYLEESGYAFEEIEDVWLAGDGAIKEKLELTFRKGQPAGMGHVREFVVSQVDKLLGFHVVPETVLRTDRDTNGQPLDVMSVQKFEKARELTEEELVELGSLQPSDPQAKRLMRMAALDYLLGATDGHGGNILKNEETGELIKIDNAYSMGLTYVEGTKKHRELGVLPDGCFLMSDAYVSVPLEFSRHTKMELDEEALAGIQDCYDQTMLYLGRRQTFKQLQETHAQNPARMTGEEKAFFQQLETAAAYPKYLTQLFRMAYRSDGSDPGREIIAQKELEAFMERCVFLLKHKRPPDVPNESPIVSGIRPIYTQDWEKAKNARSTPPNPFVSTV